MMRQNSMAKCVVVMAFAIAAVGLSAANAWADPPVPVINWLHATSGTAAAIDNITSPGTNSPTVGNGTAGNVNNETIFGSMPTQHINPGQAIALTGQIIVSRTNLDPGQAIFGGNVRFGLWNAVNPNAGPATGWLGYFTGVGSGPTDSIFETRNPDDPTFNSALFNSDQGVSFATTAGPAPVSGSPLDGSGTGSGTGRFFKLGEFDADRNAPLLYNTTYDFKMQIIRSGAGTYVASASVTDHSAFTWNSGGITDFDGLFPPANGGTAAFTSHLTADFNRVGLLFASGTQANSANLTNVQVTVSNVPEPSTIILLIAGALSVVAFRALVRI
jgi:hypothetical protein